MTAYVGSLTAPTAVGTQTITGVGFQPNLVIFFGSGLDVAGGDNLMAMFGASDGVRERAMGYEAKNDGYMANAAVVVFDGTDASVANVDSFDADGFTLDWIAADSDPMDVGFLALDATDARVHLWTTPTATGNDSVTGVGFAPDFTLHAVPVMGGNVPTLPDQINRGIGTGWTDGTNQRAVWSDVAVDFSTTEVVNSGGAGADGAASHVTHDADGFTLNWTKADPSAWPAFTVCLGGVEAFAGTLTAPVSTGLDSVSGLGFEPFAMWLFDGGIESPNTAGSGTVGFGAASDPTEEWSASTTTGGIFLSSAAATVTSNDGALNEQANLDSFDADGFTLDWTTLDLKQHSYPYFALASTNAVPFAPTLDSPIGGVTLDVDQPQTFQWTFSDPDAGDSQSAYEFRYRAVGAGTWTTTGQVASTSSQRTVAGGTFADGTTYEWEVRTYDAAGAVGAWSTTETFVGSTTPPAPTITAPTDGATIPSENFTVEWSTPAQDAYQLRRVADDGAGSPDTGTVYTDTGTVESTAARSRTLTFSTNNRDEHVQLRVREGGLWSAWTSHAVTVWCTVPATPAITVTAVPSSGRTEVAWVNPAPGVGEPTVTSMDVYRTVAGREDRIAAGLAPGASPYLDRTAPPDVAATYRVRAYGDNDTSVYSATDTDTLTLRGVWLTPAATPSDLRQHRLTGQGVTVDRQRQQATTRYAGREYPAVEYGTGSDSSASVDLAVLTSAERDAIYALEGRVVCLRDAFGRKMFATLRSVSEQPDGIIGGWRLAIEFVRVAYVEEV